MKNNNRPVTQHLTAMQILYSIKDGCVKSYIDKKKLYFFETFFIYIDMRSNFMYIKHTLECIFSFVTHIIYGTYSGVLRARGLFIL